MNKLSKTKITLIIFLIIFFGILFAKASFAAINLPWSTTYDCDAWIQNPGVYPYDPTCDGLQKYGDWLCTDSSGKYGEEVSTIANYPGGGGGKGQIHYIGNGTNSSSGGLVVQFNAQQSEFWMRSYVKYASGLTWDWINYQKMFYINAGGEWHNGFVIELKDTYLIASNGLENWWSTNDHSGWRDTFSDNNWHCVEFHAKLHTVTQAPFDGIIQIWLDGKLILDKTDTNFGSAPTNLWDHVHWGSNAAVITSSSCNGVYYDDIAISNTGKIGCDISFQDTTPPSPPTGVIVI